MSINYLKNLVLLNQKIKENKNQVRREPPPRIEKESKADLLTKSNLELKAQINQASKNISGVKNKTTKISSPYTAQMIKEYKMNMDKPVIIDGKSYKYHPIKFPESENLGELTALEQDKQIRIQEIKNDFNDVKYKINVYKYLYEKVKGVLKMIENGKLEFETKFDELQTFELTQDIVNEINESIIKNKEVDDFNMMLVDMIRTIKNNQIPQNLIDEYNQLHEQPKIIEQLTKIKDSLTDDEQDQVNSELDRLIYTASNIFDDANLEATKNRINNFIIHYNLESIRLPGMIDRKYRELKNIILKKEEDSKKVKENPEGKGIHGGALEDEQEEYERKLMGEEDERRKEEYERKLMGEEDKAPKERETEEEIQIKINLMTEMKLVIGKMNVVIRNIKLLLTELINKIDTNNIIYNNIETELTNAEQEYLGAKNRREMEERNLKTNISSYEQTIKQLNSNMIISKNPEESEEEYLARLASYGTMPLDDKETLARAQTFNLEIFKNNLREITNNESKIEEVYNHFNSIDPGIIGEFNKIFPLFLDSYKKIFGINNISVKSSDIINFIERFMESRGMEFLQPQQMTLYMPPPIIQPTTQQTSQGEPIVNYPEVDETETPISFYFEDENNDGKNKLMYRGTKLFFISKVKKEGNTKLYVSETGNKGTYRELTQQRGQAYITTKLKNLMGEEVYNYFLSYLFPNTNISKITIKDLNDEIIKRLEKYYNLKEGEEIKNYSSVPQQPVYGFGINKRTKAKEEYKKIGKIYISPDKLNKNVLSIQNEKRLKIKGLKNKHISDNLADAFLKISNNNNLTNKDINILDEDEKLLLDNILYIAGLHKNISGSGLNSVEKYKNKLNLIVGEIEAGNNNNKIKSDLYDVLFKLVHFGALGEKEARNYYKNILTNYF